MRADQKDISMIGGHFHTSDAKESICALQTMVHSYCHRSLSEPKLGLLNQGKNVRGTHTTCDMAENGINIRQNNCTGQSTKMQTMSNKHAQLES